MHVGRHEISSDHSTMGKAYFCTFSLILFYLSVCAVAQTDVSQYTVLTLSYTSTCSDQWAYYPQLVSNEACAYGFLGNDTYYYAETSSVKPGSVYIAAECQTQQCLRCKVNKPAASGQCIYLSNGVYGAAFRPSNTQQVTLTVYSDINCQKESAGMSLSGAICRSDFVTGDMYIGFDGVNTVAVGRYCVPGCNACPVFQTFPLNQCVFISVGVWAIATL